MQRSLLKDTWDWREEKYWKRLERGKILEDSNKIFRGILQYVEEVRTVD